MKKSDENEYNRIINCTCIYTVYLSCLVLNSSKFVNLIVNMQTTAFYLQMKQANKQGPSERYLSLLFAYQFPIPPVRCIGDWPGANLYLF